ncbi:MAG: phosphotransferase family protein [Acidimicrobiales bacterium]|nr:phosphotransferase family protein [Acidimicrobiales bacterium]
MDDDLRRWVEDALDRPVTSADRWLTGGSRELWFAELGGSGGTTSVVVRSGSGGALSGTEFDLTREATAYRALGDTPVPVPRLLAAAPDGGALVLERLPGTSGLGPGHVDDGDALLAHFMAAIGALHALDPDGLHLPGFARPDDATEAALVEVRTWGALAGEHGRFDPILAYALAWLAHHPPGPDRATCLVQGDTGPGNFVHDGSAVTGLVDWELCHLGDPMDDVAWIDMRAPSSGPFADVGRRDRLYEAASGIAIDPAAVRYHAVMVQLRCAVITALAATHGSALGRAAYMAPHHRFRRQLAADLADASGHPITTLPTPEPEPSPLHDGAVEALRDEVMPALARPHERLRAREAVLVLEHERARGQLGPTIDAAWADDARATLGRMPRDDELVALAVDAGRHGDPDVLDLLARRAQRDLWLWDTPSAGGPTVVRPPARAR